MKKIVVIGASSGLGRLVAEDFARRGWYVGIAARRAELLQELAAGYPENMLYRAIDVTSDDATVDFRQMVEDMGGMDVMFFASGVGFTNPELDTRIDSKIDSVNVAGFTRIVSEAYKWFAENGAYSGGKPQIAAITSVAGTKGLGVAGAYSSSKRYQQTYLQSLSQLANIQGLKLCVTDIRPGFIRTDLLDPDRKYPMIMKAPYAARKIVRSIMKRKRVSIVDWRWRMVVCLWKIVPDWLWRRLKVSNL